MDVFVARQPIFDANEKVVAFELLFRSDYNNSYNNKDGDKATIELLNNCFMVIGMDILTEGKKAYVNFTQNLILNKIPELIPKEFVVVEILEDVEPTEEVIDACKKLKDNGYTLALDDYIYDPKYDKLIEYVDIIKVDFIQNTSRDRKKIVEKFKNNKVQFLAEKIETREEFCEAHKLGYTLFQGYFFSKPVIFTGKDMNSVKINELQLLSNLKEENLDFKILEDIIKRDVTLAYKILKIVNSSAFGFITEVNSIMHALVILGEQKIYQFIYLATLVNVCEDKNSQLLTDTVVRAKFGELLACEAGFDSKVSDIFLMEILSNMDCFINKPLEEILAELPISKDIKDALLDKKNSLYYFHKILISYQKGEWIDFEMNLYKFDIDRNVIPNLYIKALKWFKDLQLVS